MPALPEIEPMPASETSSDGPRLLAVSCAGGMARQFRVQVCDLQQPGQWSLVGSFRDQATAGQCAREQSKSGRQVRVVACQSLPTAA
jgi:hypothetical protein